MSPEVHSCIQANWSQHTFTKGHSRPQHTKRNLAASQGRRCTPGTEKNTSALVIPAAQPALVQSLVSVGRLRTCGVAKGNGRKAASVRAHTWFLATETGQLHDGRKVGPSRSYPRVKAPQLEGMGWQSPEEETLLSPAILVDTGRLPSCHFYHNSTLPLSVTKEAASATLSCRDAPKEEAFLYRTQRTREFFNEYRFSSDKPISSILHGLLCISGVLFR